MGSLTSSVVSIKQEIPKMIMGKISLIFIALMLINIDCNKRVIRMLQKLTKDVEALHIAADERYVAVTAGKPSGRPINFFSDQGFRFDNITNLQIWYDDICVAGIQVQYGEDLAPYHGRIPEPTADGSPLTMTTMNSPIVRVQGTVGEIMDSIGPITLADGLQDGPVGNPLGGSPYDTNILLSERGINPDNCRIAYFSGGIVDIVTYGTCIQFLTFNFYCEQ